MLTRPPSARLLAAAECIWYHESSHTGPQGRECVLPDGRFHVVLKRSETLAQRRLAILEAALIEIWSKSDTRRLTVHPAVKYALQEAVVRSSRGSRYPIRRRRRASAAAASDRRVRFDGLRVR